jgi:hypothetical protein
VASSLADVNQPCCSSLGSALVSERSPLFLFELWQKVNSSTTREAERATSTEPIDSSPPSSSCSASKDTAAEATTTRTLRLRLLRQHRSSLSPRNRRQGFPFHIQNRPNDQRRLRSTSRSRVKGLTMEKTSRSSPQQRNLVGMGKVLVHRVCCPCCLRRNRWHP